MIAAARTLAPGHPWLSPGERARLVAMRPARAAEFTTGRVLARALVAEATGLAPAEVTLAVRPSGDSRAGMPWTPDADGGISIAHSGGVVLVAYRPEGDVGVDVEAGIEGVSRPGFPAGMAPATALDSVADYLPEAERPRTGWTAATLATAWVRREAVVKCLGVGLIPVPELLTLAPSDARPAVLACALAPAAQLAIVDLDVGGLPGALAVRSEAPVIRPALPEVVDAGDLVPGAEGVGIRLSLSAV